MYRRENITVQSYSIVYCYISAGDSNQKSRSRKDNTFVLYARKSHCRQASWVPYLLLFKFLIDRYYTNDRLQTYNNRISHKAMWLVIQKSYIAIV